jgi:hypothetical protein
VIESQLAVILFLVAEQGELGMAVGETAHVVKVEANVPSFAMVLQISVAGGALGVRNTRQEEAAAMLTVTGGTLKGFGDEEVVRRSLVTLDAGGILDDVRRDVAG